MFPYFFKYLPENTVKHDADKTPIIIRKSPFNVEAKFSSTFSDIQNDTPAIASRTAIDLLIVIFSILKNKQ